MQSLCAVLIVQRLNLVLYRQSIWIHASPGLHEACCPSLPPRPSSRPVLSPLAFLIVDAAWEQPDREHRLWPFRPSPARTGPRDRRPQAPLLGLALLVLS